jgi:putative tricarboxylic transport membrane protein
MRTGIATYSRISPRAVPYLIAGGLAVLGVAVLVNGLRPQAFRTERFDWDGPAWVVSGLAAQIALLPYVGFSLATAAVFAATARAFGRRPFSTSYLIGVPLALAIWLIFAGGLRLTLPSGPIERMALSWSQNVIGLLSGAA